jgi:hypothetical protein
MPPIFWFKPITRKQATPTAILPLRLKHATMPLSSEQATLTASSKLIAVQIQTTGAASRLTTSTPNETTIQPAGRPSRFLIQTDNFSSFITNYLFKSPEHDDCSYSSPSIISPIPTDSSVDLPLHSTAITEATTLDDPTAPSSTIQLDDPTPPSSTVPGAQRPTALDDDPTAPLSTITVFSALVGPSEASVDLPLRSTATVADPSEASVDLPLRSTATVAGPPPRRPTSTNPASPTAVVALHRCRLVAFLPLIMSGLQTPLSLAAQGAADAQAAAQAATATQAAAQAAQTAGSTISTAKFYEVPPSLQSPYQASYY